MLFYIPVFIICAFIGIIVDRAVASLMEMLVEKEGTWSAVVLLIVAFAWHAFVGGSVLLAIWSIAR